MDTQQAARLAHPSAQTKRYLVGFVRWNGDIFHGMVYAAPCHHRDDMALHGYVEVWCNLPAEDATPAPLAAA